MDRSKREKPGFKDLLTLLECKVVIWTRIIRMVIRRGPFRMIADLRRYPWILDLLKVNNLLNKMVVGRSGEYRKAVLEVFTYVVLRIVEQLEDIFYNSDKMILQEDLVPTEIFRAMGLKPWTCEIMGIVIPMVNQHGMERYIDAAENDGIPADNCSLTKATMGMFIKGCQPPAQAIVTSNLPCDGGMTGYNLIQQLIDVPMFSLSSPYNFKDKRAWAYFSEQLREMIVWLEEHTPGRMDWDRLREICEERNRMVETEMELWDMLRCRPAPMAAEAIFISHLWAFNILPGAPCSTKLFRDLTAMCRKNMEANVAAVKNEKYRAILWNTPTIHAIDLTVRAENAYGVAVLIDSLTFNQHPIINTESQETMLEGLSRLITGGAMVNFARGPAENFFDEIYTCFKTVDADMIWMAGHISCKHTMAVTGMLREKCREMKIPLLIIDYDLLDPRIVGGDRMFQQVEHFMDNVMKAERLDR